ncbi:sensor histidine kinase [Paenibacillus glycanilyticus]|uniref:Histidine kinase/HSP90-like ATPase domain-containing protein n=1 Tax=Paenibacillus glycanilyticus TaxID=126569 RepID=A0ABQ6GGL5_9BACL|nr:sensor histidine kinase [Paenibacillus glycanilyticus]GLX68456.1 hypothetical protein MU1_28010 [Paenibacillus glycanilyticus]
MKSNMDQTISILKSGLEGKLNLVESVSHNISYNTQLQNFLSEPFVIENGSMDQYIQSIKPIVYYGLQYNQVDISSIMIYMNNHSIPEGFGSFNYDTAAKGKDWYDSFMKSNKRSYWIFIPEEGAYSFLQKIVTMEGEFLGVSRVSILKKDLFVTLNDSSADTSGVYIKDASGLIIYGKRQALVNKPVADEQMEWKGSLYIQSPIDRLNLQVGMSQRIPRSLGSYQLLTMAGFIAAIILSILMFYQVLKMTFVKIKASMRAMDHSIRTGFSEMVPVERNDEIGVISEKFNTLLVQINRLVTDMVKRETIHKDAQLKALQAQINPHFIYNTINLFSAKTELAGLYDVSEAFADFGQMLRYNMNGQSEFATVKQEIDHVESYIRLQQMKYGERLQFQWSGSSSLLQMLMIRFILQPIVENSITHGISKRDQLLISLDINLNDQNEMVIVITDNGTGISEGKLYVLHELFQHGQDVVPPLSTVQQTGNGIGLSNINNRLRLFYGEAYSIKMESVEDLFTRTILTIPCQLEKEAYDNAEPHDRR